LGGGKKAQREEGTRKGGGPRSEGAGGLFEFSSVAGGAIKKSGWEHPRVRTQKGKETKGKVREEAENIQWHTTGN